MIEIWLQSGLELIQVANFNSTHLPVVGDVFILENVEKPIQVVKRLFSLEANNLRLKLICETRENV